MAVKISGINVIDDGRNLVNVASVNQGFVVKAQGANEGGEFSLEKPASGTILAGNVIVDINANSLRFFENGGAFRGAYLNLSSLGSQSRILTELDSGSSNIQIFDSSGTWTKPPGNYTTYKVEVWGAGGSGGTTQPGFVPAGGGGGGGCAILEGPINHLGATETVTIGAGGIARGPGTNLDGFAGGNSSFTISGPGTNRPFSLSAYGGGGGGRNSRPGGGGGSFYGVGQPGASASLLSGAPGGPDAGSANGEYSGAGFKADFINEGTPLETSPNSIGYYGGGAGGGSDAGYSFYGGAGGTGGSSTRCVSLFNTSAGGNSAFKTGSIPGGGGFGANNANNVSGAGAPGRVRVTVY